MIERVKEKYSESLGAVRLYHTEAEEGCEGYIDEGLIIALLGDGEVPVEMQTVREYAFLCSAQVSLCEVWAVECRTYSGARDVYALFEKRKKLLSAPEYDNAADAEAAGGITLVREGKCVFFAVHKNGSEIVEYLRVGE